MNNMTEIQASLGYLLNTSAKLIKRKLDSQLKQYHITTAQWAVLKLLSVDGELSQANIAARLHADRATSGAIIDNLMKKRLLTKEQAPHDRRSYLVKITAEARIFVTDITNLAADVNEWAVQGLSETETKLLCHSLNTIISNMGGDLYDMEG